ncbi:MAG TPA: SDR family oxidoreductase [Acidimicrobiales bacterium]|nr:SDR family oxidoreductase [Acidimicrobiales bacterium]
MGNVVVTGGTGGLGTRLVDRLLTQGHTVSITSRNPSAKAPEGVTVHGVDLTSGRGLAEAVDGADVIVHAATNLRGKKEVEVGGARRLLDAIGDARPHLIYVSIVGVDRHHFAYYRTKYAAEQVVEAGPVPFTIQRATQFHSLLYQLFQLPISGLPYGSTFQPIDTSEVVDRFVELVDREPAGRVDDIGGPEVLDIDDLLGQYEEVLGKRPRCFTLPATGKAFRDFGNGVQTSPDHRYGKLTWRQFLEWQKGQGESSG